MYKQINNRFYFKNFTNLIYEIQLFKFIIYFKASFGSANLSTSPIKMLIFRDLSIFYKGNIGGFGYP